MHIRAVLLGAAVRICVPYSWGLLRAYACRTLGGCCVHVCTVLLGAGVRYHPLDQSSTPVDGGSGDGLLLFGP